MVEHLLWLILCTSTSEFRVNFFACLEVFKNVKYFKTLNSFPPLYKFVLIDWLIDWSIDCWFLCGQWVEVLEAVHHVLHWCEVDAVDAIMSSDVSIRLARLYEFAALLRSNQYPAGTEDTSRNKQGIFYPGTPCTKDLSSLWHPLLSWTGRNQYRAAGVFGCTWHCRKAATIVSHMDHHHRASCGKRTKVVVYYAMQHRKRRPKPWP